MAENDKFCVMYLGKKRGQGGTAGIIHVWKMMVAAQTRIGWSRLSWMLS